MDISFPKVRQVSFFLPVLVAATAAAAPQETKLPSLPVGAKLAFQEDWSSGKIAPARWYIPRKKWGVGNNGVSPENVRIVRDKVEGKEQPVLVC